MLMGACVGTQVTETLRTLQASSPLQGQEVAAGAYVYYRYFVDRAHSGLTFSITPSTGAAEVRSAQMQVSRNLPKSPGCA